MITTYKVMLHLNNKQNTRLFEFAGAARYAYNWALGCEMKAFESGEKFLPEGILRKQFTEFKKQPGNEWMYTISNNVFKQAIRDCMKAYDRFFKLQKKPGYVKYNPKFLQRLDGKKPTVYNMTGHPKFKTRKHTTPSFYQDPIKIQFSKTHVKLEKITDKHKKQQLNWIKLAEFDRIPINGHYSNPRITFDGLYWWLSIGVEIPERKPIITQYSEPVGVDLGVKSLAVVSNGTVYKNINKSKRIKKLEKHLRQLQRSISRKYNMNKKGESYKKTCNIIKSEIKLKKLHRRLSNIRHNYIQAVTSEIVYRKPRWIALEDLNVKGMMKNKHLSKHIQDCCWSLFRQLIVYRANRFGIKVVLVDRFYSSSKTCSHCGYKQDMPLSKRVYKCPQCGMIMDRDLNAAINIKNYGETH